MYTLETLIVLLLVALVIGLVAGGIIAQRIAPSRRSQREMEESLEEMKSQQSKYQKEVAEHFCETGQLLNQLTKSYQDVHNHLASGVQLLGDQDMPSTLTLIEEGKINNPTRKTDSPLTPPLEGTSESINEDLRSAADQPNPEENPSSSTDPELTAQNQEARK